MDREQVIRDFAQLWWSDPTILFAETYLGIPVLQHPFDAWITQEIISETRPERIVECGVYRGGSALMWAGLLQHVSDGQVIAVDIEDQADQAREHPLWDRVTFLQGSTVDPEIVEQVAKLTAGYRTMVILDSAHDRDHVLAELEQYAPLVSEGCYLVVQDGFVNGHPCDPEHGPGPYEAVSDFLAGDCRFEVDRSRERMLFTFNPSGFLRRK